jgi:hypothetical protein
LSSVKLPTVRGKVEEKPAMKLKWRCLGGKRKKENVGLAFFKNEECSLVSNVVKDSKKLRFKEALVKYVPILATLY